MQRANVDQAAASPAIAARRFGAHGQQRAHHVVIVRFGDAQRADLARPRLARLRNR